MSASSQAPFPQANAVSMTAEEEEMLATTIDVAKQALFAQGAILPQAVLRNEEGKIFMLLSEPFGEVDTKDRFALSMRVMSVKHRAVALCFLSEAWAFDPDAEGADLSEFNRWREENPEGSFGDYPGAGVTEHVMVVFESHTGSARLYSKIHRTADGTPYILNDYDRREYYTWEQIETYGKPIFGGRFSNLLAPRDYWDTETAEMLVAVGERILSGHLHDPDSEFVKNLAEDAKKHDQRIPRDLQN